MALDLDLFSDKLKRYCAQLQVSEAEIADGTGIEPQRIASLLGGSAEPFGDEVLIFADYFQCDFKFFISNEILAPFEQTEELFRSHGSYFTKDDRWNVQEFLFLCESQHFIMSNLYGSSVRVKFRFDKIGNYHIGHGIDAAKKLREELKYSSNELYTDIFNDFRNIGIHIFRRKLGNSNISGVCIKHPVAGKCVLVNYDEDIFRQRFTVAHEAAHAILDDSDVIVSKSKWKRDSLSEIRANAFASSYLMPPDVLTAIPNAKIWNDDRILQYSKQLMVNPEPLSIALKEAKLISEEDYTHYKQLKIPIGEKEDAELSRNMSQKGLLRKAYFLEKGLSDFYVSLCFSAYDEGIISQGKLAEILCVDHLGLIEICGLYGKSLHHGN